MDNSSGRSWARIGRIGTRRILAVVGPHDPPSNLKPLMADFDHEVLGDFRVCPYQSDKPGEMLPVCLESATHVVRTPAPFNKEAK